MGDRLLADAVVVCHLLFIVFALAGGGLVVWRPHIAWLHLPVAAWAAYVEFSGTICPLTPLENTLRQRAGQAGYAGGFVEHYVIPVIYPAGLTASDQVAIGTLVVAVNVAFYGAAWRRRRAAAGGSRLRARRTRTARCRIALRSAARRPDRPRDQC